MPRYIDADKQKNLIDNCADLGGKLGEIITTIKGYAKDMADATPNADVRKNIRAQKVLAGGILDGTTHWYECSCCHGAVDILDAYCKHCGAVLELENDL